MLCRTFTSCVDYRGSDSTVVPNVNYTRPTGFSFNYHKKYIFKVLTCPRDKVASKAIRACYVQI